MSYTQLIYTVGYFAIKALLYKCTHLSALFCIVQGELPALLLHNFEVNHP